MDMPHVLDCVLLRITLSTILRGRVPLGNASFASSPAKIILGLCFARRSQSPELYVHSTYTATTTFPPPNRLSGPHRCNLPLSIPLPALQNMWLNEKEITSSFLPLLLIGVL